MAADRLEPMGRELPFELFGREIVRAGQFDIFDAKSPNLLERCRHTVAELRAQAVELQADRPFEFWPNARRMPARGDRRDWAQNQREQQSERDFFHGLPLP